MSDAVRVQILTAASTRGLALGDGSPLDYSSLPGRRGNLVRTTGSKYSEAAEENKGAEGDGVSDEE